MAELFCSVDRDNRLRPSANRVKTIKACDSVGEEISHFRRACTPREQLAGIPEHRVAEADLVRRKVAFKHRTPGPEGFYALILRRPPRSTLYPYPPRFRSPPKTRTASGRERVSDSL